MANIIYALDTFTANQEGQLTVEKNEELYLLNDEHYYWWYVQQATGSQMGFVPAELVELPNERLARQNSLRNQSVENFQDKTAKPQTQRKRSVRFTPSSEPPELTMDSDVSQDLVDTSMVDLSQVMPRNWDAVPKMAETIDRMDDLDLRLQRIISGHS